MVLFPQPEGPTMAVTSPALALPEGMAEVFHPKDRVLALFLIVHKVSRMILAGSMRAARRAGIQLATPTTTTAMATAHR